MQRPRFNTPLAFYAGAIAFCFACAAQAQVPKIGSATSTPPSASTGAALAAPRAAGLQPVVPAGLTSGSGAAVARDPVAAGNAVVSPAATAATNTVVPGGDVIVTAPTVTGGGSGARAPDLATYAAPDTTVLGGPPSLGVARGPAGTVPLGGVSHNAVDVARSFLNADGNRDGELSRAEASRLTLMLSTFEEMDRNFDGVVTRSEYEDGLR